MGFTDINWKYNFIRINILNSLFTFANITSTSGFTTNNVTSTTRFTMINVASTNRFTIINITSTNRFTIINITSTNRFTMIDVASTNRYGNPSINSQCKSSDWFPHDIDLRHERVSVIISV